MKHFLRRWLLVGAFFVLLGGIFLFALVSHISTRVPTRFNGEWDYYHFHWNLWWVRHAILTGQNPFYTDMVLAPFTHNLSYHSLTPFWAPVYMLLAPLLAVRTVANLIMWLSLALTGSAMAAFMRWNGIGWSLSLLGGIMLAFSPYMADHLASGHLNLITVFWLPTALLVWGMLARTRRVSWAILTGLVLWGMWLTDTLIVVWGALLLVPYGLLTLAQAGRARRRVMVLGLLALVITLALGWFLGPLQPTLDFDTGGLPPVDMLTLRYYSLPLESLYWPHLGRAQALGFERDETPGLVLVLLVAGGLLVRSPNRLRWFWLLAGLPALLLALGPDVPIFGTRVPLPFRLIHEGFRGQMRTPVRFLPPAMVGLILFVGLTYDRWFTRRAPLRQIAAAGLVLAVIADYGIVKPYPATTPIPDYALYDKLRAEQYDDYDYVVIEVPSGPYIGTRLTGSHPEAMLYGIQHEKRMVSGLLSRIPLDEHLYYEQSPLMGWLTDSRPLDPARVNSELTRIVKNWPVGYVVVHQDWMSPERALEALTLFNAHPALCFITVEREVVLYRTTSHPKGCPPRTPPETGPGTYTVDFGLPGDEGFIGHGWFWPENVGGIQARWAGNSRRYHDPDETPLTEALLYADLPTGSAYTMTVRAVALAEARTVTVVAGRAPHVITLGTFTAQPGDWREYSLIITADLIDQTGGRLVFSLTADGFTSAAEQGLSADTRGLTLAYDWVRFQTQ